MPIPSQNEFLLPFLQILSDEGEYTRNQIMFHLSPHFDISDQLVYVGMSCARHHVVVIGELPMPRDPLPF